MGLCENLKLARKSIGLTQMTVAKEIGISNTALSNYETGYRQPDLDTLKQLANYYRVSIDFLVDLDDKNRREILDLTGIQNRTHIFFESQEYELTEEEGCALHQQLRQFFRMATPVRHRRR